MSAFEKIKAGLEEAIAYEQGTLQAKTTKISIRPVERYQADEIRSIRNSTGLTQRTFAEYMGVSIKTVEAWEAGRNRPEGAACRLLALTKSDPLFPQKSGIVVR
jgi:putative transcriptional regulator